MQLLSYLFFIAVFIMIFKRIINAVKKESQNAKIYFSHVFKANTYLCISLGFFIVGFLSDTSILMIIGVVIFVVFLIVAIMKDREEYEDNSNWTKEMPKPITDEQLYAWLEHLSVNLYKREDSYAYKYTSENMPFGRVAYFLSLFGMSIESEEPFFYAVNPSTKENDMNEYGYLITSNGLYFLDKTQFKDVTKKYIPLAGVKDVTFDEYGIIANYIDISTLKTCTVTIPVSKNRNLRQYLAEALTYFYRSGKSHALFYKKYSTYASYNNIPDQPENQYFNEQTSNIGLFGATPEHQKLYNENKNYMNGERGAGYAAEYGNNAMDRLLGKKVVNEAQNTVNGRQVKGGADRIVNGERIQTKYYKTASESIGAAFEHKQSIYNYTDAAGNEKMMAIEVPRDQYAEALKIMKKRIDSGQVKGAKPGDDPRTYVKKGFWTYNDSFCIAQSGTIQGLTVDAVSGVVASSSAAGITVVIAFAQGIWNKKPPKEAITDALKIGGAALGKGTLTYMLTMQLSREYAAVGFKDGAFTFFKKAYTKDGKRKGFEKIENPIYKASDKFVSDIINPKIVNSRVGQALGLEEVTTQAFISKSVCGAIVFGPDILRTASGSMSVNQLKKNSFKNVGSMAGAVIGQTAIPVPVVGSMVGGTVGNLIASTAIDGFIEDDSVEIYAWYKMIYIDVTCQSSLSSDEYSKVYGETLGNKKLKKYLRQMYKLKKKEGSEAVKIAMREQITNKILENYKSRDIVSTKTFDDELIRLLGSVE